MFFTLISVDVCTCTCLADLKSGTGGVGGQQVGGGGVGGWGVGGGPEHFQEKPLTPHPAAPLPQVDRRAPSSEIAVTETSAGLIG